MRLEVESSYKKESPVLISLAKFSGQIFLYAHKDSTVLELLSIKDNGTISISRYHEDFKPLFEDMGFKMSKIPGTEDKYSVLLK